MPKRKTDNKSEDSTKKPKIIDNKIFEKSLKDIENAIIQNLPNAVNLIENLLKSSISSEQQNKTDAAFAVIYKCLCKTSNTKIYTLLKSKIENISLEQLISCIQVFIKELKKVKSDVTMDKSFLQFSIVILNSIDKLTENSMLKDSYCELTNQILQLKFNEYNVFDIFKIFKSISLSEEQANIFVIKLFDVKEMKWSAENLSEFFQNLISFVHIYKEERDFVYQSIITYFHKLNRQNQNYLEHKKSYKEAEADALNLIVKSIKSDLQASCEFVEFIKPILYTQIKDKYLTCFTVSLILNLTQTMHRTKRDSLMQLLIETIIAFFEIDEKCRLNEWISNSLNIKNRSIQKHLTNLFEFNRVYELVEYSKAYKALIELSTHLIDLYGVHINSNTKDMTLKQSVTVFATRILSDLFQNCTDSRLIILKQLLNSIEMSVNNEKLDLSHSIYFDQLEILMENYKRNFIDSKITKNSDLDEQLEEDEEKVEVFILKYFLKSLFKFKLNSLCSIKLLNIFSFYLKFKNTNVKNLIELCKQYLNDENLENRRTSIYGLLVILKALIISKDGKNGQEKFKTKMAEFEIKICITIFNAIKESLLSEKDFEIKSYVYQSFCKICSLNLDLAERILKFFIDKIKDYLIIESTQSFIRLDKCLSYDHGKLIEPFDLLLHCAYTCRVTYKTSKWYTSLNNVKQIDDLCKQLDVFYENLMDTLLRNEPKYVFSIYNKQIEDKFKTQIIPTASTIKIQHQLQLGIFDVLIERQYYEKSYDSILKLLAKYEEMSNLISIQIEEFMSPIMTPKSLIKRKSSEHGKRSDSKRQRLIDVDENNNENKENNEQQQRTTPKTILLSSATLRQQHLQQQLQTPPITPTSTKTSIQNISFANIKFGHTHRISNTSLLDMLKTSLSTNNYKVSDELIDDDKLDALLDLTIDNNFIEYLNQIIEAKLVELDKTRNIQQAMFYDTESFDSNQLLKFLIALFEIFWQRIHGTTRNNVRLFHSEIVARFSSQYLNRLLKYIKFLKYIWNYIFDEYSNVTLSNLFGRNLTKNQVLKEVIQDCMDSFTNYSRSRESNISASEKIRAAILDQLSEICAKYEMDNPTLEALFKWLVRQLSDSQSECVEIGKKLIKLIFQISDLLHTPAIYLKYFLMDFENFSHQLTNEISLAAQQNSTYIKQFSLLTRQNSLEYFTELIQKQDNIIDSLEWFLNYNDQFCDKSAINTFYNILHNLIWSAYCTFNSIYNTQIVKLAMDSVSRIYRFMTNLLRHRSENGMSFEEKHLIKMTVNLIATKLQMNLSPTFNRVQRYMLNDEQQREGKADANEITGILDNKHSINELLSWIEEFEDELRNFNDSFKTINIMEKYTKFISDIEIKFHSRVTRTISEQQINIIINSNFNT